MSEKKEKSAGRSSPAGASALAAAAVFAASFLAYFWRGPGAAALCLVAAAAAWAGKRASSRAAGPTDGPETAPRTMGEVEKAPEPKPEAWDAKERARMREKHLAMLEALNRLQHVFSSTIETMRAGFLLTDADGIILIVNRALCEALDLKPGRMGVERFQDLPKWEDIELDQVFERVTTERRSYYNNRVFSGIRQGGMEVVFNLQVHPLEGSNDELLGVMATFDLLTETVSLEENLLQMNLELDRANRVKSEFLSMVSHELRTPLTLIKMYAGMLGERRLGPLTEKQGGALEVINRRCENLNDMIDDLLDLGKIEAGRMEMNFTRTDLNEIIGAAMSDFASKAREKGVDLIWRRSDVPAAEALADAERMLQVVNNLLENALKFTDRGGRIVTRAERLAGEGGDGGEECVLWVEDSGCGIEKEHFDKIFNKFYQVDGTSSRRYGGSGLGLAIVEEIVRKHGGRVWLKSEAGAGSTFFVALPLWVEGRSAPSEVHENKGEPRAWAEIEGAAGRDRPRHILIVDDDEDFLEMMKELLELEGFETIALNNGTDAMLMLMFRDKPDLILMDVAMPDITGLELCSALKCMEKTRDIPVLMLTGAGQPDQVQKGYEAGAANYLVKPFDREKLIRAIEGTLNPSEDGLGFGDDRPKSRDPEV